MKFKTDENLPIEVAELLRDAGHDAESVFDERLVGAPDEEIIDVCKAEGRCLLTLDLDFSDMRLYPPKKLNGLVVLRLRSQEKSNVLGIAKKLIPLITDTELSGRLWIVEEDRIRIRGEK